jgi:two-component system, OmpR family, sensor histidine kinase BaeS
VTVETDDYGIPDYSATPDDAATDQATVDTCYSASTGAGPATAAETQLRACTPDRSDSATTAGQSPREQADTPTPTAGVAECLERVVAVQTADVGPQPLRLHLGALGDERPSLAAGPVAAAAALIALLALGGTIFLSRRVVRPISAMTEASRRVGAGDLTLRVPAPGHDELAQLAQSFNAMADSLQQAEDRQRRLVADVAHELRTPLANLRGCLEALKDDVIRPDQQLFANLHREANLQQRIVDDLQDLALAEAGAMTYHDTRIDLADLLQTCATAHQAAADTARVTLQVHTAPSGQVDPSLTLHADPDRLRQALGNLVSNSLRATPPGGSITLEAAPTHDDHGQIAIAVHDTGTGIAPDDLPHIFDRFRRADPARTRETGGSGLGLAITRQIIVDHGGTITATSRPGTGTTITIILPRDRLD